MLPHFFTRRCPRLLASLVRHAKRRNPWSVPHLSTGQRKKRFRHLNVERLEPRLPLATLSDGGGMTLTLTLAADEELAVVSDGAGYTFGTDQTFIDGGVRGDFTPFGGSAITLLNPEVYLGIRIVDAGANATVTFNDSGDHAYGNDLAVRVNWCVTSPRCMPGCFYMGQCTSTAIPRSNLLREWSSSPTWSSSAQLIDCTSPEPRMEASRSAGPQSSNVAPARFVDWSTLPGSSI